jgi:hypothetical protein
MRAVVTLAAVPLALLLGVPASPGAGQAPMSGGEAVRAVDWKAVGLGSSIPSVMPTADSDDPVEAGFARQWVERALDPARALTKALALLIVSKHRVPGDQWAYGMAKAMRSIIHSEKVPGLTVSRVFCNTVGCLCYVEGALSVEPVSNLDGKLLREMDKEFGIKGGDIDRARMGAYLEPTWELTVIRRPSTNASMDVSP